MKANPDKFQAICAGKKCHDNIKSFRIGDTDISWHTCLGHYPLQKLCFISVGLELWLLWQLKVFIDL